jgi:hypothetical protein
MRDDRDVQVTPSEGKDLGSPLHEPGWELPPQAPAPEVPAGFGAHFRTNPPWQARRAGWRLFVRGSQRQ